MEYSRSPVMCVLSFAVVMTVTAARPAVATAQHASSSSEAPPPEAAASDREPLTRGIGALARPDARIAFGVKRGAIQHVVTSSPFDGAYGTPPSTRRSPSRSSRCIGSVIARPAVRGFCRATRRQPCALAPRKRCSALGRTRQSSGTLPTASASPSAADACDADDRHRHRSPHGPDWQPHYRVWRPEIVRSAKCQVLSAKWSEEWKVTSAG